MPPMRLRELAGCVRGGTIPFMSARSIASATVSFGLVSIPVKLYATTQSASDISFNLLHKACGSRLKQQYVCIKEEVVVPREEMIKGYEFEKDRYVTFSPDELKALEEVGNQTIEIQEFVPLAEVDPIFFDKAYFLGTDKGGERAYKLLAQALWESERSALATYAARGKQYLVLVRSQGASGLVMQQLRYADEVRSFKEVPVGDAEVKDSELALAKQIVDQLARETFDPTRYEDTVRKRVLELISRKVEDGRAVGGEVAEAPRGQIIDLMDALRKSLEARAKGAEPTAPSRAAAPASSAPAPEGAEPAPKERKAPRRAGASEPTRARKAAK